MAAINIFPDPAVLLVNTGIFVANAYAINHLIVKPFLKSRRHQESMTEDAVKEASELLSKSDELNKRVQEALAKQQEKLAARHESTLKRASEESEGILERARQESETVVQNSDRNRLAQMTEVRAGMEQSAREVAEKIYDRLLTPQA